MGPNDIQPIAQYQPMFTDHETFIIEFSVYKHHLAVAPEQVTIQHFSQAIKDAVYEHTKMLMQIIGDQPVPYILLQSLIVFNISDKKDLTSFWRP